MSATDYICSSIASQPPVAQQKLVELTEKGGVCSSVCPFRNEQLGNNLVQNAQRLYKFVVEVLRIILSSSHPLGFQMPESGDVEVLNPNVSRGVGVLARRRIGLSLDFSDISTDDLVTKRCKIESMNIQINNGPYPHNGGSGIGHRTILPSDLACRINRSKTVLVLDCRPFFAYNANHIQGAVNINCSDRFNRRRLLQGKCSLVDLVTSKEGKDLYKKRSNKEVVVYDDRTKDIKDVATDASMYIVLSVLRREGKQASILKGGLDDFQADHEDLCKSSLKAHEHKPLYSPTTPIIEPAIETATASQILPFLYLGNERDAANLQRLNDLGVTYVLNVTSHIPLHFENHGIKYKRIPASDSGQQNLRQYFEEAGLFIDEAREAGAKVLVHCQAGVSRSATITIAFLLRHSRMSMTDAYRFVKSKRQIISPNFNFMGQLLDFEQALNQGRVSRTLTPCIEEIETFV
ncbi:dual specificity protein phosphatase 10-like [Mercenaria mercenaria]|uniref:dual specificity protein phosphatase 10-like n=1 Tax=Mercenaria mercenaria TaxID=6596 RepID=UPI001E1D385C|nr:dual specificity protein phosphatase 10-like [Mercenaria mercenaria]